MTIRIHNREKKIPANAINLKVWVKARTHMRKGKLMKLYRRIEMKSKTLILIMTKIKIRTNQEEIIQVSVVEHKNILKVFIE